MVDELATGLAALTPGQPTVTLAAPAVGAVGEAAASDVVRAVGVAAPDVSVTAVGAAGEVVGAVGVAAPDVSVTAVGAAGEVVGAVGEAMPDASAATVDVSGGAAGEVVRALGDASDASATTVDVAGPAEVATASALTVDASVAAVVLTCFGCGRGHDAAARATVCVGCGMPLRVDLDLVPAPPGERIRGDVASLWRYADMLPVPAESAVTLGEGWTPSIPVGDDVWVKDESRNPTGSFKARGMSLAVSAAVQRGARCLIAPSAGNAAGALAAYGARAGVPVVVAMPADTPRAFIDECRHYGAQVDLVDGTIADAGRHLAERRDPADVDVSTMKEPYRVEGKKTMGYELFEQFGGELPDVVVYPTGGGTGLVGMWKAWDELERLGWIGATRPRLVSVQAAGCAPIVAALDAGEERTAPWSQPVTTAFGLRVPSPIGGFVCLRAIAETRGTAVAVPDDEIHRATRELAALSGLDICPEGGAAWAAVARLRATGWIRTGERTVVFNTGTGLKYR